MLSFLTQVERAKDESLQETPEFFDLNRQLIRIRREFCVVLIIEHAMTRGSFTSQDGARNVDVKHLKGALARADLIKSFQPHYQQRIARARMLLDLRECIQVLRAPLLLLLQSAFAVVDQVYRNRSFRSARGPMRRPFWSR